MKTDDNAIGISRTTMLEFRVSELEGSKLKLEKRGLYTPTLEARIARLEASLHEIYEDLKDIPCML